MKKSRPSYQVLLYLLKQALIGSPNDFELSLLDNLARVADIIVSRGSSTRYYKITIDFGEDK